MSTNVMTAIGAISGTSMDGIDVALVRTDGHTAVEVGPGRTLPYPPSLRRDLIAFLDNPQVAESDPLKSLDDRVTEAFGDAISIFMSDEGLASKNIDFIGLHGQTIWHRPEKRVTRQLGNGATLANRVGTTVINSFRQADVLSGGHGAPFAPLYHVALATGLRKPLIVLNWGGVGNVTYIGEDEIQAFDTGPASALIDDFVLRKFGIPFDEGGKIAAQGRIDIAILKQLMDNPFFAAPPPKSLDRQDFHQRAKVVETLSDRDALATLAAFTIEATAAALAHVPQHPSRWLVAGGGRHNSTLMTGLGRRLGVSVEPVESEGWQGDLIEAQCFGYLAVRSALGLPLSLPTTTGVPYPMPGGQRWVA